MRLLTFLSLNNGLGRRIVPAPILQESRGFAVLIFRNSPGRSS